MVALVLSLGVANAFADTETAKDAGNFSVNITNNDSNTGHKYVAYQVFAGDLVEKTDATATGTGANLVLSNIVWGTGVDGDAIVSELAGLTSPNPLAGLFTSNMTAADVAAKLDGVGDDTAVAQAFAEVVQNHLNTTNKIEGNATSVTGLNGGYYFIQDEGTMATDTEHPGALTRYILQVVHSVNVTQKANVPQIDKKTKNKNDSTGDVTEWQNTADYDVGDTVPFQITGTLPSNFAEYDYFKTYTMTDTLSAGLTAPTADGISIKVGDTSVKDHFDINFDGQKIIISLKSGEDLKTWNAPALSKDSKFVVEYSAVLNESAVSGTTGNKNEVTLTFSNNPNADGEGSFDTTPPSTVIVFTYDLNVGKVDGANQPLDGARFALYKKFKSEADLAAANASRADGKKYVAVTEGKVTYDEGRQTYNFVAGAGEVWALVTEITTGTTFAFDGIDAGSYVLVETATPSGYNSVAPYAFEVTAELDDANKTVLKINGKANGETVDLGSLSAQVVLTTTEGSLNTSVVNNSGTTLPSTGGIGTTIFYAVGGVLVLAAIILLVTKKRMSE